MTEYSFQNIISFSIIIPCKCMKLVPFNGILVSSADTGPRLNKKDGLTRYGDSHVKDKTS